jgi:hypothetical protein
VITLCALTTQKARKIVRDFVSDWASNSVDIFGWLEHNLRVILCEIYRVVFGLSTCNYVLAVNIIHRYNVEKL